jgi:hypothetical protein
MTKFTGGCACGAVRYEIDAQPVMQLHCQCSKCRKLSGTGHTAIMAFPGPAVKLTGRLAGWSYIADSGATATRYHCPACGSPISGETTGVPGVLAIMAGSLDDPSVFKPQAAVFTETGQHWDVLAEHLPRFAKMPPM